jgi:hypothetical protein
MFLNRLNNASNQILSLLLSGAYVLRSGDIDASNPLPPDAVFFPVVSMRH